MSFRVRIDPVALRQIDQFATYLRDYSDDFATDQIERLDRILRLNLGEAPLRSGLENSDSSCAGLIRASIEKTLGPNMITTGERKALILPGQRPGAPRQSMTTLWSE
jgi:hypothetical protein